MSCKEKRDNALAAQLSGSTQQIEAVFASLWDRLNLPGNIVANLWIPDGFPQLCALYPNKFIPTSSSNLIGPDPRHATWFFEQLTDTGPS